MSSGKYRITKIKKESGMESMEKVLHWKEL